MKQFPRDYMIQIDVNIDLKRKFDRKPNYERFKGCFASIAHISYAPKE